MAAIAQPALADGYSMKEAAVPLEHPERVHIYSGLYAAQDIFTAYGGFLMALRGDLGVSGWRLRQENSFSKYEYDGCNCVGIVDGRRWQSDFMIGYEWVRGGTYGLKDDVPSDTFTVAAFVGVDYIDHHLSPDRPATPSEPDLDRNPVRGDEVGVKFAIDIEKHGPFYFNLQAEYSTAFDEYWALLRVGMMKGRFIIGPEVMVDGDESYDDQRYGVFVGFDVSVLSSTPSRVYISAGYLDADDGVGASGESGLYGTIGIGTTF